MYQLGSRRFVFSNLNEFICVILIHVNNVLKYAGPTDSKRILNQDYVHTMLPQLKTTKSNKDRFCKTIAPVTFVNT